MYILCLNIHFGQLINPKHCFTLCLLSENTKKFLVIHHDKIIRENHGKGKNAATPKISQTSLTPINNLVRTMFFLDKESVDFYLD